MKLKKITVHKARGKDIELTVEYKDNDIPISYSDNGVQIKSITGDVYFIPYSAISHIRTS